MFTTRGLINLGCLALLLLGLVTLLYVLLHYSAYSLTWRPNSAGYPVISHFTAPKLSFNDGFNYGGSNASGIVRPSECPPEHLSLPFQVPELPGRRGPIDPDTPDRALTKTSLHDGSELKLIFSYEFNNGGRTFYPEDDPYWEAVDLHYWQTGNLEWYDPLAVTIKDGALRITLSKNEIHD